MSKSWMQWLKRDVAPAEPVGELRGWREGTAELVFTVTPAEPVAEPAPAEPARTMTVAHVRDTIAPEKPLVLELGLDLVPLVAPELGGTLMGCLDGLRAEVFAEIGLPVNGLSIKDNLKLRPNTYQLRFQGMRVAHGEVLLGYHLAVCQPFTDTSEDLVGFPTRDAASGRRAVWVAGAEVARARLLGYTVLTAQEALLAHVRELLVANAATLLSLDDVGMLASMIKEHSPATWSAVFDPSPFGLPQPHRLELAEYRRVLQGLLAERVSIAAQVPIFEAIAAVMVPPRSQHYATVMPWTEASSQLAGSPAERARKAAAGLLPDMSTDYLVATVRRALAPQLTEAAMHGESWLSYMTLHERLVEVLENGLRQHGTAIAPGLLPDTRDRVVAAFEYRFAEVDQPVVICPPALRQALYALVAPLHPRVMVLATDELVPGYELGDVPGVVRLS